MPVKIGGLPAHVLLIHAVVVLLPLAAIMLVLGAVWPAARRKFGFLTPALALVGLVLVPITTHAGQWLQDRLPESKAIRHHADLGHQLLPWAAGLFVMSAVVWLLGRRYDASGRPATSGSVGAPTGGIGDGAWVGAGGTATLTRPAPTRYAMPVWMAAVVAVLSIAVAVGTMIMLYRIGESGAHAVWNGVANLPAR